MKNFRLLPAISLVAIIFLFVVSTASPTAAQAIQKTGAKVTTEWAERYSSGSIIWSLKKTDDGGYIIAGATNKTSGTGIDGWYAKVNADGQAQWQYASNFPHDDTFYSVQQTSDGGFVLAGASTNDQGQRQALLGKYDGSGKLVWARNFSGQGIAEAKDVKQTSDGGYVIAGSTQPLNGTGTAFIIKTDNDGNQQGTMKVFDAESMALALQVANDGGYVFVGRVATSYGFQLYLVKTDPSGNVMWKQRFGQNGSEVGYAVLQTKDGGYVCAGKENAYGEGGSDALLLKTDPNGQFTWQNNFGTSTNDAALSVQQTEDGGYILGGYTNYTNVSTPMIIKANANGNYSWDAYWPYQGAAEGVLQTNDDHYVFAGPDFSQSSPFLAKITAESGGTGGNFLFNAGNNSNLTWILGVVVLIGAIGVIGTYFTRRSKTSDSAGGGGSAAGAQTFCRNCGSPVGDNTDYCNQCGTLVKTSDSFGGGGPTVARGDIGGTTQAGAVTAGAVTVGAATAGATQTQRETQSAEQREVSSPPSFPTDLGSRYSQVRYLGEGGFARVFSALDLKGDPVAVKVLKSRDPKAGKLFATEAANWSVLRHENIVRLYDYNIFPVPYLESELCDSSVEREMSYGALPVGRAIELMKQVAYGLSYAHQRRILHGDIKPSNILIKGNTARISDWGLSKMKMETSVSIAGVTLQYAAPEQLSRDFGGADERTDIYQLGALLYQCVTGRLPFADTESLVDSILRDEPAPPSQFRQISRELENVILRCLQKRKEERYQSADELVRELDAVAS